MSVVPTELAAQIVGHSSNPDGINMFDWVG